jgi:hypothetical protein
MCSRSFMCGVSDYKVFTSVSHGNNNHQLLTATLQLRLQVPPRATTSSGVWDELPCETSRRQWQTFAASCEISLFYFLLTSWTLKVEWSTLEREIFEAMGQGVRKARPAHCHKPGFTQATLFLLVDKHWAHRALLGHP